MPRAKLMHSSAEETEAAFYDALGRADIDAMMALWAEDEEIICVHPNAPRLIGHAAIRATFEALFERGGVHVSVRQLHTVHNMSTSIHSVIENIHQTGNPPQELHILATNVYLKTPRGWCITLHHASIAPGPAPEEMMSNSAMLH
ncbi:YybH family protein [Glaciimonas soli]|uniref:DUF4440 domain-containing protein n=1 Tax=Glaciimonas soli TaxID=2590999 RepID=A0A843YX79_9BURK|nr:nuclear transport factor 2 family protein [Glaciimonas soli]MQR01901.1 DUF4440 domain-containing protein [Glaciimonas soli]